MDLRRFLVCVGLAGVPVIGQMAPIDIVPVPLNVQSGAQQNPTSAPAVVFSTTVRVPGVSSFRLLLNGTSLGDPDDRLVISEPFGTSVQILTRSELERTRSASAWFNGDRAHVALELRPGSRGELVIGAADGILGEATNEDICGGDNRVPSNDNRACRLLINSAAGSGLCTGWMISDRSTFLTAGHCFGAATNAITSVTAEFNVPPSTSAGSIVHPPAADQFQADLPALIWNEGSIGSDWAVGRILPGTAGLLPSTLHGWYDLATAVIPVLPGRLTGYGDDSTPDPTRHRVQQTSTDSLGFSGGILLNPQPTGSIFHDIDSQPGNSGGPLVWETTGLAVGIHTHGGCTNTFGSNEGTSIFFPPLQGAIALVNGCASVYLPESVSMPITCTPTIYTCSPIASRWNIVAVTSPSNWNIQRSGTSSNFTGSTCDFLLSDGNLGPVPPISGEIRRASGASDARAQHSSAFPITLGLTHTSTWNSTRVLRAFEFPVNSTAAPLEVSVGGDPSLRWHVYSPDSGLGAEWRQRTFNLLGAGIVGAGLTTTLTPPTAGNYCLVVYRDGGPLGAAPAIATIGVTVCQGTVGSTALSVDAPVMVTPSCSTFTINPSAAPSDGWKAVGLASTGNYGMSIGTATSALASGRTEFVVSESHPSSGFPIQVSQGYLSAPSGSPAATAHFTAAALGTATQFFSSSLPAGHVIKLLPFSSVAGSFSVLGVGESAIRWYVLPASGTTPRPWRGPNEALATGSMGGGTSTITLPAGQHVVVVVRDGAPSATASSFTLRVGLASANVALTGPGSSVAGIPEGSTQFSCVPTAGRWTAVGVWGSSFLGQGVVHIGATNSGALSSGVNYCIADGRSGTVTPSQGILTFVSQIFGGGNTTVLHQASATQMTLGSPTGAMWGSGQAIHLFEFQVTSAGLYNMQLTGVSGLVWNLFSPTGSATWRPRADQILTGSVGGATLTIALSPGWHSIAVLRGTSLSAPTPGLVICTVTVAPNPVPTLTALAPNSVPAGDYLFAPVVVLSGTAFAPTAFALMDGSLPLPLGMRTATSIEAFIAPLRIMTPGTHTLQIVNPAPGGGSSALLILTVTGPNILSVSPSAMTALPPLSLPVSIVVDGSGFHSETVLWASGTPLSTTFLSQNQLSASVGAAVPETAGPGGIAITARNGQEAQSNTVVLRVGPEANNRGTLVRRPLLPSPGQTYVAVLEAGTIGQPLTLLADLAPTPPIPAWPDAASNFVLGVNPAALTTLPLLDGLGLFGPPQPGIAFQTGALGSTAPGGVFLVPGFIWPTTPIGIRLTLQHVYTDPSSPVGFRLSWTRIEDL